MEKSENKNVPAIDAEVFNTEKSTDLILYSLQKEDGSIDKDKLKEFIRETVKLRKSSSEVYEKITKGLLHDWHYPPETVLSIVENLQKNMVDKSKVCDDMLCLVQDEGTKQLVLEYFGKIY